MSSRVAYNLDKLMRETPSLDTQQKLARRSGVGQSSIGRIRRGEISTTVDTLDALALAFGLTAADLLQDPEEFAVKAESAALTAKNHRLERLLAMMSDAQVEALEVLMGGSPPS
jgi:transcriptional regulator with XRE-family HTH domain